MVLRLSERMTDVSSPLTDVRITLRGPAVGAEEKNKGRTCVNLLQPASPLLRLGSVAPRTDAKLAGAYDRSASGPSSTVSKSEKSLSDSDTSRKGDRALHMDREVVRAKPTRLCIDRSKRPCRK